MTYRRDDGSAIDVEHVVEQRGHPGNGWDDDGEQTIVCISEVFDLDGNPVTLSDQERERIEMEIAELLDTEPMDIIYDD